MALVAIVVPWRTCSRSAGEAPARARAFRTPVRKPCEGSAGVLGVFVTVRRPDRVSSSVTSVNVPPTSRAMAQLTSRSLAALRVVVEPHVPERFGRLQTLAGPLLAGPPGDHLRGIPRPHLAPVLLERGQLDGERLRDVDEGVGMARAEDEHALHLVRHESLVEKLRED